MNELKTHTFNLSPKENGGESLILTTKFCDNGDGVDGIFVVQELTLHSYSNTASIYLGSMPLKPETLRKLADELNIEFLRVKEKIRSKRC